MKDNKQYSEDLDQKKRSTQLHKISGGKKLKYWAFISYSSKDQIHARWLHSKIENYLFTEEIQKKLQSEGYTKQIRPIFWDRAELASSADIGESIESSLRDSKFLIVLCSTDSAQSMWVNAEIEYFQSIGREKRIIAIIIDGEPTSDVLGETCFPVAFNRNLTPLAGDLRPGMDGKERALVKTIAGITNLDFDTLYQRHERQARKKRRKWITALASSSILFAVLAGIAFWQKTLADQAREKEKSARDGADGVIAEILIDVRGELTKHQLTHVLNDIIKLSDQHFEKFPPSEKTANKRIINRLAMNTITAADLAQNSSIKAAHALILETVNRYKDLLKGEFNDLLIIKGLADAYDVYVFVEKDYSGAVQAYKIAQEYEDFVSSNWDEKEEDLLALSVRSQTAKAQIHAELYGPQGAFEMINKIIDKVGNRKQELGLVYVNTLLKKASLMKSITGNIGLSVVFDEAENTARAHVKKAPHAQNKRVLAMVLEEKLLYYSENYFFKDFNKTVEEMLKIYEEIYRINPQSRKSIADLAKATKLAADNILKIKGKSEALPLLLSYGSFVKYLNHNNPDLQAKSFLADWEKIKSLYIEIIPEKKEQCLSNYLKLTKEINRSDNTRHNLKALALAYQYNADFFKENKGDKAAFVMLNEYLKFAQQIDEVKSDIYSKRDLANANQHIGNYYLFIGSIKALKHYEKFLTISKSLYLKYSMPKDLESMVTANMNVGSVAERIEKNTDKMMAYYSDMLRYAKQFDAKCNTINSARSLAIAHEKLLETYLMLQKGNMALDHAKKSMKIFKEIYRLNKNPTSTYELAISMERMSAVMLLQKNNIEALRYSTLSLEHITQLCKVNNNFKHRYAKIGSYYYRSTLYNDKTKQNIERKISFLRKARKELVAMDEENLLDKHKQTNISEIEKLIIPLERKLLELD